MLTIKIENYIKTELRNIKSKFRSLILFGSPSKVKFGSMVLLRGNLIFGESIHLGSFTKIRGRKVVIGDNVYIHENVFIRANIEVKIGRGTTINRNTSILDKVKIGEFCSIAPNCVIVGSNHNFLDKSTFIKQQGSLIKGIVIEDDVWVSANVTILDGVTIGRGAVIAAGAVVSKNVKPYSVVGGIPAKVIGNRE